MQASVVIRLSPTKLYKPNVTLLEKIRAIEQVAKDEASCNLAASEVAGGVWSRYSEYAPVGRAAQ